VAQNTGEILHVCWWLRSDGLQGGSRCLQWSQSQQTEEVLLNTTWDLTGQLRLRMAMLYRRYQDDKHGRSCRKEQSVLCEEPMSCIYLRFQDLQVRVPWLMNRRLVQKAQSTNLVVLWFLVRLKVGQLGQPLS
jgi:hypothetical protein